MPATSVLPECHLLKKQLWTYLPLKGQLELSCKKPTSPSREQRRLLVVLVYPQTPSDADLVQRWQRDLILQVCLINTKNLMLHCGNKILILMMTLRISHRESWERSRVAITLHSHKEGGSCLVSQYTSTAASTSHSSDLQYRLYYSNLSFYANINIDQ